MGGWCRKKVSMQKKWKQSLSNQRARGEVSEGMNINFKFAGHRHQSQGQGQHAWPVAVDRVATGLDDFPRHPLCQPHELVVHIDDLVEDRSISLVSRRSRGQSQIPRRSRSSVNHVPR